MRRLVMGQRNPSHARRKAEVAGFWGFRTMRRDMKILSLTFIAGVSLALTLQAAPVAIDLDGNTQNDRWTNSALTSGANPGYGTFPGSGNWPAPIQSNVGGDATLNKTANGAGGGPYPASGSIYFGGFSGDQNVNGGTLAVTDNSPVANLQTVVFQLEIGEASTHDFYNGVLPTLSYNGGNQMLSADYISLSQVFNGTVEMPTGTEPLYINTYGLQWDLSGISETITSFTISFNGVQHAQVYSMQLDQSDTFTQAVPEPSTYALFAVAGAFVCWRLRRRARVVNS